jgi:hypothetical protein
MNFDLADINKSIKLLEFSDEDIQLCQELITRTKKYMSRDERRVLIKIESVLDLVVGIKKLNNIEDEELEYETNFFRSMDEEDKKNMMIKEILEVFPERKQDSIKKAVDMKKKIDVIAELFLPDDFSDGVNLGSFADIEEIGSVENLKLLGNLMKTKSGGIKKKNNARKNESRGNSESQPNVILNTTSNDREYEYRPRVTESKNKGSRPVVSERRTSKQKEYEPRSSERQTSKHNEVSPRVSEKQTLKHNEVAPRVSERQTSKYNESAPRVTQHKNSKYNEYESEDMEYQRYNQEEYEPEDMEYQRYSQEENENKEYDTEDMEYQRYDQEENDIEDREYQRYDQEEYELEDREYQRYDEEEYDPEDREYQSYNQKEDKEPAYQRAESETYRYQQLQSRPKISINPSQESRPKITVNAVSKPYISVNSGMDSRQKAYSKKNTRYTGRSQFYDFEPTGGIEDLYEENYRGESYGAGEEFEQNLENNNSEKYNLDQDNLREENLVQENLVQENPEQEIVYSKAEDVVYSKYDGKNNWNYQKYGRSELKKRE